MSVNDILSNVLLAVLTALASIAIAAIYAGRDYVLKWIKARTTKDQQEVIGNIAREAYAYAEKHAAEFAGDKIKTATAYLDRQLVERGISITTDQLSGALQRAWEEYGKKPVTVQTTTYQLGSNSEVTQIGDTVRITPQPPLDPNYNAVPKEKEPG